MRRVAVVCAIMLGSVCGAQAVEQGLASFYGDPKTGELTAAHRTLPFGSQVKVVNLDNGRSVVVKIVDRGPYIDGRIIDVSPAVATSLGFRDAGLAHVRIDRVSAETAQAVLRLPPTTSSNDICRLGADRMGSLRSGSAGDGAAASRRALGCEDLPARLFAFAETSEDVTPFVARGAYLTEMQAAASIPESAIAASQEKAERQASLKRAALARADASASQLDAAARISVSALLAGPEREPGAARPAGACGAGTACESRKNPLPMNPVSLLFAQLGKIFD